MRNALRDGRPVIVVILCAAWSCSMPACGARQQNPDEPGHAVDAGTTGQVGGIAVMEGGSPDAGSTVVVASYRFDAAGVHPREAVMAFGAANPPRSDGADYTFQLVGGQDRALAQFAIMDPRRNVVEEEGLVEVAQAIYAARFPFQSESRGIRVLDATGREVARTDLTPVIRDFCSKLRDDRECQEALRGLR